VLTFALSLLAFSKIPQLSLSWCYLAVGGDKLQESYLILQELVEKFGPSMQVATALGVCQLHLKKYTEAAELFKEARELATQTKQRLSADTVVNSIVCEQHLRKADAAASIAALTAELQAMAPRHAWLRKQAEMDALFDKCAQSFAA
jgi:hypothetical protein